MKDYFGKVHSLVDSLVDTGNFLPDKEVVTYLLNGLGFSYEAFITAITKRAEPIFSLELYEMLLIHESGQSHQQRSLTSHLEPSINFSVNTARDSRGRGNFCNGRQGRGRRL